MLYQLIIAGALVLFAINLTLNLRSLRQPDFTSQVPSPLPFVSILVPARNEETNIQACVNSLRLQDYPEFEILVLDDNSIDNTAQIAIAIRAASDAILSTDDAKSINTDSNIMNIATLICQGEFHNLLNIITYSQIV